MPLRSKDFQTLRFKALEQQWKPSKASILNQLSTEQIYLFGSTPNKEFFHISRFKANIFRHTTLKSSDGKETAKKPEQDTRTRHRSSTDFQQNEFIYSNPPPPTNAANIQITGKEYHSLKPNSKGIETPAGNQPSTRNMKPLFCSEAPLPRLFFKYYKNCSQ